MNTNELTWSNLVKMYMDMLVNGGPAQKKLAERELTRMAELADKYIAVTHIQSMY